MNNLKINSHNITIESSKKVYIKRSIEISGTNTSLPIEIIADFSNIPEELHHIYLDSYKYTYNNDTKIFDNTKPEPPKPPKSQIIRKSGIFFDWFIDRFK
jgi:hypothetical protein